MTLTPLILTEKYSSLYKYSPDKEAEHALTMLHNELTNVNILSAADSLKDSQNSLMWLQRKRIWRR